MSVTLTILGSGTSHGVPMIGCDCAVCTSNDPRDRRTRTSAVFSFDGMRLLIDTGPELRLQCVACGIDVVHAVAYTHAHADHIVGLDDLRRFNWLLKRPLDVYGAAQTLAYIEQMFGYAFHHNPEYPSAKPELIPKAVEGPFELFGRRVTPLPYKHGTQTVMGFRIGDVAYCPDCNFIPDDTRALMRGLDVLVLNALRRRPHPTHFTIEEAVEEARRIGAGRTYFTHVAHELGHAATNAELPSGMELAYDGLVLQSG
jgi:phosphoribosyl 1,2-cyclic phosphate phosphodiesterase